MLRRIIRTIIINILGELVNFISAESNISTYSPRRGKLIRPLQFDPRSIGAANVVPYIRTYIIDLSCEDQLILVVHIIEVGTIVKVASLGAQAGLNIIQSLRSWQFGDGIVGEIIPYRLAVRHRIRGIPRLSFSGLVA